MRGLLQLKELFRTLVLISELNTRVVAENAQKQCFNLPDLLPSYVVMHLKKRKVSPFFNSSVVRSEPTSYTATTVLSQAGNTDINS
jgi:hypothetical protein